MAVGRCRAAGGQKCGEPVGIRTQGPKIKSLVLYQLSYGLSPSGGVFNATPGRRSRGTSGRSTQSCYFAAEARCIFTILSGLDTEPLPPLPRLMASTCSMPSVTWPQMVYWPSRCGAGANMI